MQTCIAGLSDGLYQDVGTIIAMSIVHDGPPPWFFSRLLFDTLISKEGHTCTVKNVIDCDIRDEIEQVYVKYEHGL